VFVQAAARSGGGKERRRQGAAAARSGGGCAMREHAHNVLGVPVMFTALVVWDRLARLPETRRRVCTSNNETCRCAAMLLPAGGELFSIYIDGRHGMFVQAQGEDDRLYVLNARWGALRAVLPPDSSCLVVVYTNRAGKLVLGVYDVLRVGGLDKSRACVFERQALLCDLFKQTPPLDGIERHWVGHEASLFSYMQVTHNVTSVPFEVCNMLRLCSCTGTTLDEYEIVLKPLMMRTNMS